MICSAIYLFYTYLILGFLRFVYDSVVFIRSVIKHLIMYLIIHRRILMTWTMTRSAWTRRAATF